MNAIDHLSNKLKLFLCVVAASTCTSPVFAQHNDVEFGYEDGKIAIEFGDEGQVFESEFATSGLFEQTTDDPGFETPESEGLVALPGDTIDYQILGPLMWHDGTDFATVPAGAKIVIGDNPTGGLDVDSMTAGPVSGTGILGVGDAAGVVHEHLEFTLEPKSLDAPEFGAFGLLMQLTSDNSTIEPSDPFYVVFNFGLDEPTFEAAVGDYAARVPEPTTAVILGVALGLLATVAPLRRSRRNR